MDDGKLEIYSTANQDPPIMEGKKPLLGLDVGALRITSSTQNRRPDYITAFWNLVNWDFVNEQLKKPKIAIKFNLRVDPE